MRSFCTMLRMALVRDLVLGLVAVAYLVLFAPAFAMQLFTVLATVTGGFAVLVLSLLFGHACRRGLDNLKEKW